MILNFPRTTSWALANALSIKSLLLSLLLVAGQAQAGGL